MDDDNERLTPTEPVVGREKRRQTPPGMPAVSIPPRPEVLKAPMKPTVVLRAEPANAPSDPPKIPEVSAKMEELHPRFDRAPTEKTWEVAPPELVANSPGLRSIEAYSRDGSERTKQVRSDTRELKAEFKEFVAVNAGEHTEIKLHQAETNSKLEAMTKALPDAARAGRKWSFATGVAAAVVVVAGAIGGYYEFQTARVTAEAAREQAAATRAMVAATARAMPAASGQAR